jgi:hypothetical protein
MKSKLLYLTAILALTVATQSIAAPKKNSPHPRPSSADNAPNQMSERISALLTLHQLQVTREQLEVLQKIAPKTAAPVGEQKPLRIKQDLKHLMQEFHDALVAANNSDKIESLEEKYDGLVESEKVEFDDAYDTTEAASEKAEEFARSLTAAQVVSLISANQDDIKDPRVVLVETLSAGRTKTGADWEELRDTAADDVATLVAGSKATDALTEKYQHWLDEWHKINAHKIDDAMFAHQFSDLMQAASKIVGPVAWHDVLQNWVESSIADLLSNPELSAAVNERLK